MYGTFSFSKLTKKNAKFDKKCLISGGLDKWIPTFWSHTNAMEGVTQCNKHYATEQNYCCGSALSFG